MHKIFNPLSSFIRSFTPNYAERLYKETEQELYLAKDSVIKAAVHVAHAESVLKYQQSRVTILQDSLDKMKGVNIEKVPTRSLVGNNIFEPIRA